MGYSVFFNKIIIKSSVPVDEVNKRWIQFIKEEKNMEWYLMLFKGWSQENEMITLTMNTNAEQKHHPELKRLQASKYYFLVDYLNIYNQFWTI